MVSALLLAACALLAAGGAISLLPGRIVRGLDVQLAGTALLAAGATIAFAGGEPVGAAFHDALSPALGLDRLSAFFLLVVAATALPALLLARDALPRAARGGTLAALTAAFVLVLAGVLAARDVVTFLAGWELMTLLPAAAILVARPQPSVRRAVFVYLAVTHLGGVGVWAALLALAHEGALAGAAPTGGAQALVAVAALVGFGTKAGLMPLHAWLPRAHPVAPSHVSALMSGVMTKVALYGLIRVLFEWDAPAPAWVGLALIAVGLLSALGGILSALVQRELKRLLAFSTIENVGIVALGLGAAIVLADAGAATWSALALAAALLHVATHAVAKALLFLGAGAVGDAAGGLELDRLGGLLGRMPWSGWSFLVGCAAIAGIAPLGGFVSEWLTLQALLHVAGDSAAGIALAGALAAAGLAATAALAALCFTTVAGLALLGPARSPAAAAAVEAPRSSRAALLLLAALCVLGGLAAGALVPALAELAPAAGGARPDVGLGLALPGTGALPVLGIAAALLVAVALARIATRGPRAAVQPAWTCGQPVEAALAWTPAGFAKPLRIVLARVLRPQREVVVRASGGVVQEIVHRTEVPHLFDVWLYAPVQRGALRAATVARRLQSGSVRAYLAYLLALVVVLVGLARLGWLA